MTGTPRKNALSALDFSGDVPHQESRLIRSPLLQVILISVLLNWPLLFLAPWSAIPLLAIEVAAAILVLAVLFVLTQWSALPAVIIKCLVVLLGTAAFLAVYNWLSEEAALHTWRVALILTGLVFAEARAWLCKIVFMCEVAELLGLLVHIFVQ